MQRENGVFQVVRIEIMLKVSEKRVVGETKAYAVSVLMILLC